jgi:hypothetical protein
MIDPESFALTPKQYVAERNKALLNLDDFIVFCEKYAGSIPERGVVEMAYHKLRTAAQGLPLKERKASYEWLCARNYTTWDDGDLR